VQRGATAPDDPVLDGAQTSAPGLLADVGEEHVLVDGTALFVDVRRSSVVVEFVERHHGFRAAAVLFQDFLRGAMARIDRPSVVECQPSGDAVLALFAGPTRTADAVRAARDVVSFVRDDLGRRHAALLRCDAPAACGRRECDALEFDVGIGVDDGRVSVVPVRVGTWSSAELVGTCVSYASKLSGVGPAGHVAMVERVHSGLAESHPAAERRWSPVGELTLPVAFVDVRG
jgi:hypothetical protein